MKLFQGHVNGMDLQKLTATDSMMKSLAIMSKSPDVIAGKIAESIEKAFKDLLEGLKTINETSGAAATEAGTGVGKPGETATAAVPGAAKPAAPNAPMTQQKGGAGITAKDIETAMVSALSQVTVKTSQSLF